MVRYIMSDINGHFRKLYQRLDSPLRNCRELEEGTAELILLGNYMGDGTDSYKTLKLIYNLKFSFEDRVTVLLGDREKKLLEFLEGEDDLWLKDETSLQIARSFLSPEQFDAVERLVQENEVKRAVEFLRPLITQKFGSGESGLPGLVDWLKACPDHYETDEQIFIHAAGSDIDQWLPDQADKDLIQGGGPDLHQIQWDGHDHFYVGGASAGEEGLPILKYDVQTKEYYAISHHVFPAHPQMPLVDRAAQFSPFAALTGYEVAIRETERLTTAWVELDAKLRLLAEHLPELPMVAITYFQPDERKDGGAYVTVTGGVKKIDGYARAVILMTGELIPVEDILEIEGEALDGAGMNCRE